MIGIIQGLYMDYIEYGGLFRGCTVGRMDEKVEAVASHFEWLAFWGSNLKSQDPRSILN